MRVHRDSTVFALAFALLGLIALGLGCSKQESTGPEDVYGPESQTVDLNDSYGGFLAVDEDPAFGDAQVQVAANSEKVPADGFAGLPATEGEQARNLDGNSQSVRYCLTVLWGDLQDPEWNEDGVPVEKGTPIVWDGSMSLSFGAIKLLAVVDFEPGEDEILPRDRREDLAWHSTTTGYLDGVRVIILLPADSAGLQSPQTLALTVGEFSKTINTADLENLDELHEISDSAKVSLHAFRIDPFSTQARGFCNGRWGRAADDSVGTFAGHWIGGRDGLLAGYMRGHYGVNDNGEQVFFGKYVHADGSFGGFLRGHWEASGGMGLGNCERGSFDGEWVDEGGAAIGRLRGHWTRGAEGPGIFSGTWRGLRSATEF
jgi:hypothetical protein